MFIRLQFFTEDDLLDPDAFSGRYVYLVNNSHIVVINSSVTQAWVNAVSEFNKIETGAQLQLLLVAGLDITFAEYTTEIAASLVAELPEESQNFEVLAQFNKALDGEIGEQSTDLPLDLMDYVYDNLISEVATDQRHYPYTLNETTAILFYADDRDDTTHSALELLENDEIVTSYESIMYENIAFLQDIAYWESLETEHITVFRGQFDGFMVLSEDLDIFKIREEKEYSLIPNQSTRDAFVEARTTEIKNKILSAFDELLQDEDEVKNTSEITEGITLFYEHFLSFVLEL